jgi:hypothetical protein
MVAEMGWLIAIGLMQLAVLIWIGLLISHLPTIKQIGLLADFINKQKGAPD